MKPEELEDIKSIYKTQLVIEAARTGISPILFGAVLLELAIPALLTKLDKSDVAEALQESISLVESNSEDLKSDAAFINKTFQEIYHEDPNDPIPASFD